MAYLGSQHGTRVPQPRHSFRLIAPLSPGRHLWLAPCLAIALTGLAFPPISHAKATIWYAMATAANPASPFGWQDPSSADIPTTPATPDTPATATASESPAPPQASTEPEETPEEAPEKATAPAATGPTSASRPPVPIPPDANEMAWRREILAVALLGVMGVGCTVAAFLAVWILSKNLRPSDS